MSSDCVSCKGKFQEVCACIPTDEQDKLVEYKRWARNENGLTVRNNEVSTVRDAVSEIECINGPLLTHCYIKSQQSAYFNTLMTEATDQNLLLQIDFSGNFVIRRQDAIQSDHWAGVPVTIYTAVTWTGQHSKSIAVISDYLSHDKYATAVYNDKILDLILPGGSSREKCTVNIFSDGASQHFKQRYTLAHASLETRAAVNWHFFATSHGKGAVDGVGEQSKGLYIELSWPARKSQPTPKNLLMLLQKRYWE